MTRSAAADTCQVAAAKGVRPSPRRSQRGVALLTAVVLVALATVVATAIAFDTTLAARRGGGGAAFDEAQQIAGGAEALAATAVSQYLKQGSGTLYPDQAWARPIGPVEVLPGATLEANLVDLQGRFNLNDLTRSDGTINTEAVAVFERLLERLELEPDWAAAMADWIDDDNNPTARGAEDAVYTGESPAYRPPNRVITSASEMLALKDFGLERWLKLQPYVTALPRGVGINLCSASGPLLDALSSQLQWSQSPDGLQRNRAGKCFPDTQVFESWLTPDARQKLSQAITYETRSSWFQLRTLATIGTSDFALYSLLFYEGSGGTGGRVRVVNRSFTE